MGKNTSVVAGLLAASVVLTLAGCTPSQQGPDQPDHPSHQRFTGSVRELPPPPPSNPMPISPELKAQARKEIAAAARSPDPLVRAHAMESIRQVGGTDGAPDVLRALNDNEPVVRLAGTLAAGEMRLEAAHQTLLKMIADPDPTVRVGVRFALHRLRDTRFSHELEKYAKDPDVSVRADTAMVLGMLGEPSAIRILKELQFDHDPSVRLQAAEGMWRLGNKEGVEQLVAATFSKYVDDQAVAYLALAGPRDPKVLPDIRSGLTSPYNQIALISARAAGQLGSDLGYPLAIDGTKSSDPMQRLLAAFALDAIGRTDSQPALAKLMQDPIPDVRLAASTAILMLKEGR